MTINDHLAVSQRYGIEIPELWAVIVAAGMTDPHHPDHLQFSDLQWMTSAEMANYQFPADQVQGLIPFAHTAAGDLWCWYAPWQHAEGLPVVFCPHEDEVAVAYAPHFEGFLYRACIEEYACTCLTEYHAPGPSQAILGAYATRLQSLLRPSWAEQLSAVAGRPLLELEHGYFGTLDQAEAEAIWRRDLGTWPLLDTEFEHFLGN